MLLTSLILAAVAAAPRLEIVPPPLPAGEAAALLTARLDLAAAAACYPQGTRLDPASLRCVVDRGADGLVELASQFDPDPDVAGGLAGSLTVRLPREQAGRTFLVVFDAAPRPLPPGGLQVTQRDGVITIASEHYAVTHDPAKMAGLPSRIELRPSGKVCDSFALNDRIYNADTGGFSLRNDLQPELKLVAAGPLRTVVRVKARYLQGDKAPDSRPAAAYEFAYYPNSPRVDVSVRVQQTTATPWAELHAFEINFPDQSFPGWYGGSPPAEHAFEANSKGQTQPWAALADGPSLVGVLGSAMVYDGRGGYGTYLHGPWVNWSSQSQELAVTLYLSGAADSREAIAKAAAGGGRQSYAVVAVPDAVRARLRALRDAAAAAPRPKRERLAWLVALAERDLADGDLGAAWAWLGKLWDEARQLPNQARALDAWVAKQKGWRTLASDSLIAAFDGPRLASLFDIAAARECLAAPSPLWQMQLRDGAKKLHDFGPDTWPAEVLAKVAVESAAGGLVCRFQGCPVVSADGAPGPAVTLTVKLQGARLTTHLKVDNETLFTVWRTRTPVVSLAPLGPRAGDDTLCCPNGPGVLYHDPIGRNAGRSGQYPDGWWTMQWTAWFDRSGGVFLAALDPRASQKSWSAQGSAGDNALHQTVDWPMPNMGVAGNDWDQPGVSALEIFRGDWYDAAQIYRRWAEAGAAWWPARNPAKHTPDSMRDVAVWAQTGGSAKECVERVIEFAKYMDVPTAFHWYSWHQIPFDVQYPHYDPPKDGMADGVKALEAAGVRVMPYINARLWDTALDDFKAEAHRAATCDEDGKPYIEEYGSGAKLAPMCPTTALWQDKVRSIVTWIQNGLGTSGVYLDQVAAAAPRICFNPDHGHPLGGGDWWTVNGYWPLLGKLRAAMAPGKFITTECNAEPYVQYFDGYLTWHWQEQDMVPAFSAVYADQVVLFSRAYGGDDLAVRMKAAQQLCFGEQLGWIDPGVIKRASGSYMRKCAQMRTQFNDYIAHGRMRRPPAVTGEVPQLTADWKWAGSRMITMRALQTAAWQAPDGRLVLLFANFSPDALEVEYHFTPAEYGFAAKTATTVVRRTSDGASPARRLGGAWTAAVSVPAEDVIAYEVAPAK